MNKVLFHVDELSKWTLALANVKNIIKEFKQNNEDFHIILLANSEAVKGLLDLVIINEILSIDSKHLSIKACNNSIKSIGIDENDLNSFVEIVPSGVYEIAKRQNTDKYAYIKP